MENKYVVVYRCENELYAQEFDNYDDADAFVNGTSKPVTSGKYGSDGENIGDEKAYIIRIENICMGSSVHQFKLTLESHT